MTHLKYNNRHILGEDEQERTIVIFGTHDLFLFCFCQWTGVDTMQTQCCYKSNRRIPYLIQAGCTIFCRSVEIQKTYQELFPAIYFFSFPSKFL